MKFIRHISQTADFADWAAKNGHLNVLKWLGKNGVFCTERGTNWAADSGHLKVLKWLSKNGIFCTEYGAKWADI